MFGCLNESFFGLNALYPEWRLISFWSLLGYGGLLYLFMKSLEKDLKTITAWKEEKPSPAKPGKK